MNVINKQRFLAELGKLLTFMCDEDRQTALAMYNKMFDDAADEQQLMSLLVSPTRQAVVVARVYNAKERKAQLEARANGQEPERMPDFMLAIDKLYQQVAPRQQEPEEEPEEPANTDQFSLFEDDAHPIDDSEYIPFQIEAEAVPIEEPVEQLPLEEESSLPKPEIPAEEEAVLEDAPKLQEPVPEEEPAPLTRELPAEPAPAPAVSPFSEELNDWDELPETRFKAKTGLLILFVILAVPLTLIGVALLLIPTALALGLAVGLIAAGSAALIAAFSGFATLADILIVLGSAVVVLAIGLLFLWLFIWFIGGAIVGLIRAVIALGRKWCYEEVPV